MIVSGRGDRLAPVVTLATAEVALIVHFFVRTTGLLNPKSSENWLQTKLGAFLDRGRILTLCSVKELVGY